MAGLGTEQREANEKGPGDLDCGAGEGRAGEASAGAARAKWRGVGEGEAAAFPRSPPLHLLDGPCSRPDAGLRLSREGGGYQHTGEPNLCSPCGERDSSPAEGQMESKADAQLGPG